MTLIRVSQNLLLFLHFPAQKIFRHFKIQKIFQVFRLQPPPTQPPMPGEATPGTRACWPPATLQVFVFPSPSQTSWPFSTCMLSTTEEKYFIILKIFGKLKQKSFAWPHYCKHPLGKRGRNQNYLAILDCQKYFQLGGKIFIPGSL